MNKKDFENLIKEQFKKIPSDKQIKKAKVNIKYANAFYQGKFDVLMDLLIEINKEK